MTAGGGGVNAEQARRWDGQSGRCWVVHRERHRTQHQNLVPPLLAAAAVAPGERVLDVGCGCGDITLAAARSAFGPGPGGGAGGRAVGVDLSGPMLAEARRLAAQAVLTNAAFVRADAQVGPLRSGAFDAVVSKFGVMFFDDPGAAFRNIALAARPGGRLAFLCWRPDAENEVFAIPLRALGALQTGSGTGRGGLFEDPVRLAGLLAGAGWTGIEAQPVTVPARIGSDVDDVIGYMRGMSLVRRAAAEAGDDQAPIERALDAMAGEYAARQAPDGIWVEAAAWLVTARRAPG